MRNLLVIKSKPELAKSGWLERVVPPHQRDKARKRKYDMTAKIRIPWKLSKAHHSSSEFIPWVLSLVLQIFLVGMRFGRCMLMPI